MANTRFELCSSPWLKHQRWCILTMYTEGPLAPDPSALTVSMSSGVSTSPSAKMNCRRFLSCSGLISCLARLLAVASGAAELSRRRACCSKASTSSGNRNSLMSPYSCWRRREISSRSSVRTAICVCVCVSQYKQTSPNNVYKWGIPACGTRES